MNNTVGSSFVMKLTHKIVVASLASVASASLMAAILSFWYLWHLASRVCDPDHGLIHSRLLGNHEAGTEFNVYLNSTESMLVFPELYLTVGVVAAALLIRRLGWTEFRKR